MADRRYGSDRWKRLRRAILRRDDYACRIQGPRCTGYATSVHHIEPSSRRPDLFWEPSNLVGACGACNYADGARVKAENERRRLAQLHQIILDQDQQIQELLERLSQYEPERPDHAPRPNSPKPAIY